MQPDLSVRIVPTKYKLPGEYDTSDLYSLKRSQYTNNQFRKRAREDDAILTVKFLRRPELPKCFSWVFYHIFGYT